MTKFEKAALRFVRYNEAWLEYRVSIKYFDDGPEYTNEQRERIIDRRWEHLAALKEEAEAGYSEMLRYLRKHQEQTDAAITELAKISEEYSLYDD